MDLPDCPPGAEGYEDTVTEVPKKPDENTNTKAEQEFQEHISSLKIKAEDGSYRSMVERRGRDASGKWIYMCLPCAAMCCGETIMQMHISGKKHKNKLSTKNLWPLSTFQPHKQQANQNAVKKTNEENEGETLTPLEVKLNNAKKGRCHIEDTFDTVKAPLIGVEYLVEHPPLEAHYEPSYICTLCNKQGHPRTIVNHMTCFWHRHNYLQRHYPKACDLLKPYRSQAQYRDGVMFIMGRIAQRIVEKYGRMNPINIDKEDYDKEKEFIHKWIYKGKHFAETEDCTFEEVVDNDLIATLHKPNEKAQKDPSPPIVAVPKPGTNRQSRRKPSVESLSDLSDELDRMAEPNHNRAPKSKSAVSQKQRFEPYGGIKVRDFANTHSARSRYPPKPPPSKGDAKLARPANYEYKVKLADEKRQALEDAAKKTLAYHEKNPEKHPLYPEEWKKFWNRRYKEIQAEGKDPSKHDFKPEWIVFWTARMRELHRDELRVQVMELYRKLCLTPPPPAAHADPADKGRNQDHDNKHKERRRSPEPRRRPSFDTRRHTPDFRRSPDHRRPPPDARRRSPDMRRPPPDMRDARRRSPDLRDVRRRSPDLRRRSPPFRRNIRSPIHHDRRRSPPRRHSPPPIRGRSRSPIHSMRSPGRVNIILESRGSRSPLSRRDTTLRNRSPGPRHSPHRNPELYPRNRSPLPPPSASLHTVLISDDELKPDDGLSPWNSDNDIDSLGSLPDARSPAEYTRTGSVARSLRHEGKPDIRESSPENIVATLRLLVALEDYLGSLGPKVIDLLAEAIRMEKEKANSSEELLERESAVVLLETAKERLKGAAQAGLVGAAAAAAVRAAVVRAAATLHEADKRTRAKKAAGAQKGSGSGAGRGGGGGGAVVGVAGVGAVEREQIAAQMAAALVAQGKTDVSAEELAQLVDAVVGMAEAKKREADEKKQVSGRPPPVKAAPAPASAPALSGTASALQMLQSAYDDKKVEKEEAPDAMDGLSDSDLETLLKNFNELSAEEQHSLIAYLKKLEAREPQRVERLRQYVSAAARNAPVTAHANANPELPAADPDPPAVNPAPPVTAPPPAVEQDLQPVTIESDDDDYTVEEVFKSATEKVKENQIRQEMEIVKKSLEESKAPEAHVVTPAAPALSLAGSTNLLKNMTSAADLLALVQASLQSANVQVPAQVPKIAEVVTSNTHPRSFGDLPEAQNPSLSQNFLQQNLTQSNDNQQSVQFNQWPPQNLGNYGGNNTLMQGGQPFKPPLWEHRTLADVQQEVPGQMSKEQDYRQDNYQQDNSYNQNRGAQDNYYNQGGPQDNMSTQNNPYNSMGRGPQDNSYNPMSRPPPNNSNNQFGMGQQDNYNQMGRGQQEDFNRGPQNNFYNQGGGGLQDNNYNQGGMPPQNAFNQRPQGGNYGGMNNDRMQDNYDGRMQNSNKNNQNNRRGRGRGNAGNRGRGRGRGGFN